MLRTIHILVVTVLLAWSGSALAALDILEEVAEADVSTTTLPRHAADQVVVRDCSSCSPQIWRVNSATQYFVGSDTPPVSLADLRATAALDREAMVYVFFTPGTDEVTRVVLRSSQ